MAISECDKDMPPVPLDPDGMHQVLLNLLSNALDAVEAKGGLIRVVAKYLDQSNELLIEVVDNGIGIPPSMMKHMFELFHSTKGNRGTGLGLAVARKIVEEHEGSISVKSKQGEGSTFTVRIPVYAESLGDPAQTHGPKR
jgi:signal transduction histidine kinase